MVALPEAVTERLHKADGHINSAERKLDFREVERGLWSAGQAKARFAEAWLWLNETGVEFPPLERYLSRSVVRERLEAFQRAPKSDLMATAWEEAEAAEQAVHEVELPILTGYPVIVDRTLLEERLSRKYRFIEALRQISHVVEDVVAKRFLNLRRGDWVRLEDGDIGRVQRLKGLSVRLFVPASYPKLKHFTLRYGLSIERVELPMVEAPEGGWVESAWRLARESLFRPDDNPAPAGASYPSDACSAVEARMGRDEGGMECWYVSFGKRTVEVPLSEDDQHQLPALLEWLQAISGGDLPIAIELDDEGLVTIMIARAFGPARLLVRVIDPWGEEAAAVVDRDSFLDAFRSGLERFLRERFSDPIDYLNNSIIDVEDMQEHPFMIRK